MKGEGKQRKEFRWVGVTATPENYRIKTTSFRVFRLSLTLSASIIFSLITIERYYNSYNHL